MVRGLVSQIRPKERANILDDVDHCVIKRIIHGLYSRKIAPNVSIIHKKIKDSRDNWLLRCLFLTKKGKQLLNKLLAF
jgi:FixJ family two-component response regulator